MLKLLSMYIVQHFDTHTSVASVSKFEILIAFWCRFRNKNISLQ